MANKNLITTTTAYKNVMAKIDALMEKGSNKLTNEELNQVRILTQSAHEYEQIVYKIDILKK
ncbi:MAG: hypothetical protein ABI723_14175 [Bacteroidia bacterium]